MLPALLVLAAALLWGTTGTAQALGPAGLDPLLVGAGRLALGGALLTGFALATGALRSHPSATAPRRWFDLAMPAGCVAAYQLCFFAGVARAGVAVGTLIAIGSAPVFTGVLSWLAGQGRPSRPWLIATVLAVVGCVALVAGRPADGSTGTEASAPAIIDLWGVALALGAGLAYAGSAVGSKRLVTRMGSPTGAMAAVFGLAGLLLLPLLVVRLAAGGAGDSPVATLGVLVYLAAVPTALAYLLFGRGLASLHPSVAATLSLAEPLVAAALGVGLLGEPVTGVRVVGAVLIFAGLAASMVTGRATRRGGTAGLAHWRSAARNSAATSVEVSRR